MAQDDNKLTPEEVEHIRQANDSIMAHTQAWNNARETRVLDSFADDTGHSAPSGNDPFGRVRRQRAQKRAHAMWKNIFIGTIVVTVTALIGAGAWYTYTLLNPHSVVSESDQVKITNTASEFISRAGTFGVDYSKLKKDSVAMTAIHNEWGAYVADPTQKIEYDEARELITTRQDGFMTLLLPSSKLGGASPLKEDSTLSRKVTTDSVANYSDPMVESGFTVNKDSLSLNFTSATRLDNGIVRVPVSWQSIWTRGTILPANDGRYGYTTKVDEWKPQSMTHTFSDVTLDFEKNSQGQWQVVDIHGGNDYAQHKWYLNCDSDTTHYDVNGNVVS